MTGVFMLLFASRVQAQSSCAQTLRNARATYDQGRLHELPDLLAGCIGNGFTQQEKVEAYKLLTLAYIYLAVPVHQAVYKHVRAGSLRVHP